MLESVVGVIGAALLAIIGWAISLQSRVSVLEAEVESGNQGIRELLEAKLESITTRLVRIERKLDKE